MGFGEKGQASPPSDLGLYAAVAGFGTGRRPHCASISATWLIISVWKRKNRKFRKDYVRDIIQWNEKIKESKGIRHLGHW